MLSTQKGLEPVARAPNSYSALPAFSCGGIFPRLQNTLFIAPTGA